MSSDDDDDDDEEDTEALLAELEQIKKERAEEMHRKVNFVRFWHSSTTVYPVKIVVN